MNKLILINIKLIDMKKIGFILFIAIFFFGCEKEINITTPTILIENSSVAVLDSLSIKVEEYADIDGERLNADYFDWYIENSNGEVIAEDFPDSETIVWIPQEAGYFLIKVKIGYDKNKSITSIREITIIESVASLQNKIIGHWKGKGTRGYDGGEWGIELFIDSSSHFYGTADYYAFNPHCEKGVFNMERLDYFHGPINGVGSYQDSCGIPGEKKYDKIKVLEIEENKGKGKLTIGWVYVYTDVKDTSYFDVNFNNLSVENGNLYFEFPAVYNNPTTINLIRQ